MGELRSTIEINTEGTKQFLDDMKQARKELEAIEKILLSKGFSGSARQLKRAAVAYRTEFIKAIKDIKEADLSRVKEVMQAQKEFLSEQDTPEAKTDLEQLEVANEVLNELSENTNESADSLNSLNDSLSETGDSVQELGDDFEGADEQIQNAAQSISDLEERNKEIKQALKDAPQKGQEGYEDLADVIAELTAEYSENRVSILEFNRGLRQGVQETELAEGSLFDLSQIVRNLTKEYSALSKEEREGAAGIALKNKIKETRDELNGLREELGDSRGFVGNYARSLGALGGPLQSAKRGVAALSNGFKLLLANPVVALLAAIVAGLTFLFKAFASTKEGAEFLDRASAALGATLDVIRDIAVNVGEGLVAAFEDPIGSIKSLGASLITNVINRFKAIIPLAISLGNVVAGALTGNIDKLKESTVSAVEAFSQLNTGLDAAQQRAFAEAAERAANEIEREARNAARLTGILQNLTDIQRTLSVERAKLNAELFVQKNVARDVNVALGTRVKILNDVLEAEGNLLNKEIEAQSARVEALRQLQAQSDTSKEDLDKLAQEEIKLANLRQQSASRELSINRQLIQLRNEQRREAEKANKAELKEIREIVKERQILLAVLEKNNSARENAIKKFAEKLRRLEIDAIQDIAKKAIEEERFRAEKIRAQRDSDFNKAVDQQIEANAKIQASNSASAEEKKAFESKTNADILTLTELNNKLLQRQEQQHQSALQKIRDDAAEREKKARESVFANRLDQLEGIDKELEAQEEKEAELDDKRVKKSIENGKKINDAVLGSIESAFSFVEKIMQAAANAENENFANALEQRQRNIDALNEDLEGATGIRRDFLEKQLQDEKEQQRKLKQQAEQAQKDQAEAARAIALTQAVVNTALAVTSALATPPYPVGVALAISAAALGAVEIASIATAKFQDGGEVVGKRHSQGGVRASVPGAADIELEGEEIIFSRRAVAFHGRDELLEANERGNRGGRKFQFGGDVSPNFQAISQTSTGEQSRLLQQLSELNISVNVTDITNLQGTQAKVTNQTSF